MQEFSDLEVLNYHSNFPKLHLVLAFNPNIKVVFLGLIKILAFVSLHLRFCRPSYGIFAKTGRVGPNPEFQVTFGSG